MSGELIPDNVEWRSDFPAPRPLRYFWQAEITTDAGHAMRAIAPERICALKLAQIVIQCRARFGHGLAVVVDEYTIMWEIL